MIYVILYTWKTLRSLAKYSVYRENIISPTKLSYVSSDSLDDLSQIESIHTLTRYFYTSTYILILTRYQLIYLREKIQILSTLIHYFGLNWIKQFLLAIHPFLPLPIHDFFLKFSIISSIYLYIVKHTA